MFIPHRTPKFLLPSASFHRATDPSPFWEAGPYCPWPDSHRSPGLTTAALSFWEDLLGDG